MLPVLRSTLPSTYLRYLFGLFCSCGSSHYVKETLGQHHHLCCVIRRGATYQGGPLKANSHQEKIGASVAVEMKCYYGGSV